MDFSSDNEGFDTDYDDYDVIIVGGGLTGLSAAYHILAKHPNLSLMIIESQGERVETEGLLSFKFLANISGSKGDSNIFIMTFFIEKNESYKKDSVGGRLRSGEGFELIIHLFQNSINQLLQELNIETETQVCEDQISVYYDKNGLFDSMPSICSSQVYYFMKSLNEISLNPKLNHLEHDEEFERLAETSINDLINRMVLSSRAKSICQTLMSLTCGFERLENVSALWILRVLHGAGGLFQRLKYFLSGNSRCFIKGGNSGLIQRLKKKILAEDGVLNCSERVSKIMFNEYRNLLSTDKNIYKCSYVIIAVSPQQTGKIIFDTQLPENYLKTQSFYTSNETMTFTAKYLNNYQHPGIIIPLANGSKHLRLIHDITRPIDNEIRSVFGYFSANDDRTEQERFEELSRILKECSNTSDTDNFSIDYSEEQLTRGFMSVLRPCPFEYHFNPMGNPFQRIFFAASEYARTWPGTADGAVEAGEHVACLVLNCARPQTLTGAQISTYLPARTRRQESNFETFMARNVLLIANVMIFWYFLRDAYNF